MRDGVRLQADIWRPAGTGGYPVLLQRTPYNRSDSFAVIVNAGIEPLEAVAAGFVVVIQDTRGRWASEGVFDPFRNEAADGFDTIQWLAEQDYSNGRVGMYGASYYAATQLLAATARPPALRAIAPQATASDYHDDWIYRGGALQLGFSLYWALGLAAAEAQRSTAVRPASAAFASLAADPWAAFRSRPLAGLDALTALLPAWGDWLAHPTRDEFWTSISIAEHFRSIDLPALHIGGWFDIFLHGTLANHRGLSHNGAGAEQRLIIGPWAHAVAYDALGEVEYGAGAAAAALNMSRTQLAFFASHLIPGHTSAATTPVRIFVMGANQWRDETEWPPARVRAERLYLTSEKSERILTVEPPRGDVGPDSFVFDPSDPAPTVGGATFLPGAYVGLHAGQRDQRGVEARADVLTYTSGVLAEELEICGPVGVSLWASTTAADTDWTAKLVDVHPDGRALNICDGIIRARYAGASGEESLVQPDTVREYRIDLGATAIVLPRGHAVRLEISSSNFPRFDVNPGYRGEIASATVTDEVVSRQTVLHDDLHPSYLELSVTTELVVSTESESGANHVAHRQD